MQYIGVILRQAIAALFLATDNIVLHPSRFNWLLLWDNYIIAYSFKKRKNVTYTQLRRYKINMTSRFHNVCSTAP